MKQTVILNAQVDVEQISDDMRAIVITEIIPPGLPGDVTIIQLPNEGADEVGKKLTAPFIVTAKALPEASRG